jgi:predicted metal-dependent hydrolase
MKQNERTLYLGCDSDSIEVLTRRSPRAKKVSIKITGHNGVELVIPKNITEKQALNFLYSKERWIVEKSKEIGIKNRTYFEEGSQIPIQGDVYIIQHSGSIRGRTRLEGDKLIVCGEKGVLSKRVKDFLQDLAKKEIVARAEIEAQKLGVNYSRITIRDTNSRWGSCSHKKNLSFSWRLIMAPRDVLEYVVAHEVAHLIEMNHSKKFWQLVESIFPSHRLSRNWLKDKGVMLHTYG